MSASNNKTMMCRPKPSEPAKTKAVFDFQYMNKSSCGSTCFVKVYQSDPPTWVRIMLSICKVELEDGSGDERERHQTRRQLLIRVLFKPTTPSHASWPPSPENRPQQTSALQCVPSNTPQWRSSEDVGAHDAEVHDKFPSEPHKTESCVASDNRR